MADPRFFTNLGPFSLGALAELVGGRVRDADSATLEIKDIAALETARGGEIAFVAQKKYAALARKTAATALLVRDAMADCVPKDCAAVLCDNPRLAQAQIGGHFYPDAARGRALPDARQDGKAIHPSAEIGENVHIGIGAMIGADAQIGAGSYIGAHSVIGHGVVLGRDCAIGAHCTIGYALLGDRVIIAGGVHIGLDGFGFVPGKTHEKIPQLGRVIIQSDVEIQAGATVDRGALGDTQIGEGTRLDAQVHIGHNVKIGRHCIFAATSCVGGSSEIGDYTLVAGAVAVSDNLNIGAHVEIAGGSVVTKSFGDGVRLFGVPARIAQEAQRDMAFLSRLRRASAKKRGA